MKLKRVAAFAITVSLLISSSITDVKAAVWRSQEGVEYNENILTAPPEETPAKTAAEDGTELKGAIEEKEQAGPDAESADGVLGAGAAQIQQAEDTEISAELKQPQGNESKAAGLAEAGPEELVRVIIVMDGDSIVESNSKAEPNLLTSVKSRQMENKQDMVASRIEDKALDGEELEIRYHYTWLTNGIAAEVPYGKLTEIAGVKGVAAVLPAPVYSIDPQTVSDGEMIGRENTWAKGYTGAGMKIAVIDTGLDYDHPSFAQDPELTGTSETKKEVESALSRLNAFGLYENASQEPLSAEDVYYSGKIPFGFNYVDESLIIDHDHDQQGDHGTHVAGIAAANKTPGTDVVGVAPDAQLYIMKVFGAQGGAFADDILAALEDALLLDADVINMSLGEPAGFTSESEQIDEIYGRVSDTNAILSVAAGNSNNSAQGNLWGTNSNLTENPDNGIISSPATNLNSTSVASVDNAGTYSYFVEVNGTKLGYEEGVNGTNVPLLSLAGQELEFALVDNYGQTMEDFAKADVKGKVAVVQRGISNFSDKHAKAQEAGAVACLIYNNVSGTFGMDLTGDTATIPCVVLSMQAGECLNSAAKAGADTIAISGNQQSIPSDTAYRMSEFSSWGVTPDLLLEPDITAPGGNIYSTLNGGTYGTMSGTSMAAPNMAGCAALVMQYVDETYPDKTDAEKRTLVNSLLVSTAVPLSYEGTLPYSPRKQGAGLVNAYNAVASGAYLSVTGSDVPKAACGDDPKKSGQYTYEFAVTNLSDEVLSYGVDTNVQTEGVSHEEEQGKDFLSLTPKALEADVQVSSAEQKADERAVTLAYDFNRDGRVDTTDARVLYCLLKEAERSKNGGILAENFAYDVNGDESVDEKDVQALLDVMTGLETDSVDLERKVLRVAPGETEHVTVAIQVSQEGKDYMDANFANGIYVEGFTTLRAEQEGGVDLSLPYLAFYGDWTQAPLLDGGYYWETREDTGASQYPHAVFADDGGEKVLLGLNPYGVEDTYEQSHNSISPNGDGAYDAVSMLYVSLLRNAKHLSFRFEDASDKTVYHEDVLDYVRKSCFSDYYQEVVPFVYPAVSGEEIYHFTDQGGNYLTDGTEVNLVIEGEVDYGSHAAANQFDTWTVPVKVDTRAPEITSEQAEITVDASGKKQYITVSFSDNTAVAAMNFLNTKGTKVLAQYPVEDVAPGETCTMTFDITGFGRDFLMIPGDYAGNETVYNVHTENNDPVVDTGLLYGYRVFDEKITDDSAYGWLGIDCDHTESIQVMSSESYMDYALTAAEYVGSAILAADADRKLVWIRPGYWDDRKEIADLGVNIRDMAFDPKGQTLYAYDSDHNRLITIDILTGGITKIYEGSLGGLMAMTCGSDGRLYGIQETGNLNEIDKSTGAWGDTLLATQKFASYAQSIAYNDGDGCIYWSYYGMEDSGHLFRIDPAAGYAMTDLGAIAGNAEVVGLLFLNARGYTLPEEEMASMKLSREQISMQKGDRQSLEAQAIPWYGTMPDLIWESSNPQAANVDIYGNVTAVGEGSAVIKASDSAGKFEAVCRAEVVEPKAKLQGFALAGQTWQNQWVSFQADQLEKAQTLTEQDSTAFSAGAYVDGWIYAYNMAGAFYRIRPETLEEEQLSTNRDGCTVYDMAYNYADGFLYGLVQNAQTGQMDLAVIDRDTGDFEVTGKAQDEHMSPACGLACTKDGTIYLVMQNGILYTYEKESGSLKKIGVTGYTGSPYIQSMTYDYNTGQMYWAMVSSKNEALLMYVDQKTGQALPLGAMDSGCELSALYSIPDREPEAPVIPVEHVALKQDAITVVAGGKANVNVQIHPFNATERKIVWTVTDPSVASIKDGMVYALEKGETTATGVLTDGQNGGNTYTVTLGIKVVASAGAIRGYVMTDISTYAGQFWSEIRDNDLSKGSALANGSGYYVYAGEYYDGKVYAYGVDVQTNEEKFMIFEEGEFGHTDIPGKYPDILDMAFDYSAGAMYAIGTPANTDAASTLYGVDLSSGAAYAVAELEEKVKTLACSTDGHLYGVSEDGSFYEIDKSDGSLRKIGATGCRANMYQTMAYDHNTGNLYWAQFYRDEMYQNSSGLKLVDTETGEVTNLGLIGEGGCQYTSMYIVPKEPIPPSQSAVTGVSLSKSKALLKAGDTLQLQAAALPIRVSQASKITFSSGDPAVATVTKDGLVCAVGYGTTEILAECDGFSASCQIAVVDSGKQMYAFHKNGWQVSPVMEPDKVSGTELAQPELTVSGAVWDKGYFYLTDPKGVLWKMTEDQTVCSKVGNIIQQMEYDAQRYPNAAVLDLAVNAFDGNLYALTQVDDGMMGICGIYRIDKESGSPTQVVQVDMDVVRRGVAFAFTSASQAYVYDIFDDTIDTVDLVSGECRQACWAQGTLTCGDNSGMVYSKELDTIFFAASGFTTNKVSMYLIDPHTGAIEKYADTAYDGDLQALVLKE